MPENLQKRYVEFYQKKSQQLTQDQIDKKLRDAEERKNLRLALKQSSLIGHHDKINNVHDVVEMRKVDKIVEFASQL